MPFNKDDLEALDEAIVCGELVVSVEGRTITYRSIDELLKARRHVANILAKQVKAANPLGSTIVTRLDRGIR